MTKQYWVDEFFVDLSRNQINQNGQSQTLPPKALQVLTYLAEKQGKVVSYEELLDEVWANAVVTPNTLQRSIAQLRKALGENSKVQGLIKTHAKQGYSLECEVRWSENKHAGPNDNREQDTKTSENDPPIALNEGLPEQSHGYQPSTEADAINVVGTRKTHYWIAASVTLLIAILFAVVDRAPKAQLTFGEHRYLTATDDKEYGAKYSADGKFIIFQRYDNKVCISDFWAKNLETLEEHRLTAESGTYGIHSLSEDNKTLTFIKQEDCTKPVTQNTCYKLMQLDFQRALSQPQEPEELLHCQDSAIRQPVWISGHNLAMRQKDHKLWRLINLNMENSTSSVLHEIEDGSIMYVTYSPQRNLLAAVALQSDGQQTIEILTPQGDLINSHPIVLPEGKPRLLKIELTFMPDSEHLIFGFGSQFYTLSEQGDIKELTLPLEAKISGLTFNPQGRQMLLIKGRNDTDIAKLAIQEQSIAIKAGQEVIGRSIDQEIDAKFQPNGEGLAWISAQTGVPQVWMTDDSGSRAISNFSRGSYVGDIHWASQGKNLLMVANWQLQQRHPDGNFIPYDVGYPVTRLFHWDSETQQAIAKIMINGSSKLVLIDLASLQFDSITDKSVRYAVTPPDGPLVFMDQMQRFWQQGIIEDELIEGLEGQGTFKQFVVAGNLLYGINKNNQLWSYDLQSNAFNILSEVNPDIDDLTDIKNNQILATILISEKFEVIELSVTE